MSCPKCPQPDDKKEPGKLRKKVVELPKDVAYIAASKVLAKGATLPASFLVAAPLMRLNGQRAKLRITSGDQLVALPIVQWSVGRKNSPFDAKLVGKVSE